MNAMKKFYYLLLYIGKLLSCFALSVRTHSQRNAMEYGACEDKKKQLSIFRWAGRKVRWDSEKQVIMENH